MKHTIKGFITLRKDYMGEPDVDFYTYDPRKFNAEVAVVSEHSFDVEIPDAFDPTGQLVSALEGQKRVIQLETAQKLMALDERISKLTCLTHEVPA